MVTSLYHHALAFYLAVWELNSGPRVCAASAAPAEPSPQAKVSFSCCCCCFDQTNFLKTADCLREAQRWLGRVLKTVLVAELRGTQNPFQLGMSAPWDAQAGLMLDSYAQKPTTPSASLYSRGIRKQKLEKKNGFHYTLDRHRHTEEQAYPFPAMSANIVSEPRLKTDRN